MKRNPTSTIKINMIHIYFNCTKYNISYKFAFQKPSNLPLQHLLTELQIIVKTKIMKIPNYFMNII